MPAARRSKKRGACDDDPALDAKRKAAAAEYPLDTAAKPIAALACALAVINALLAEAKRTDRRLMLARADAADVTAAMATCTRLLAEAPLVDIAPPSFVDDVLVLIFEHLQEKRGLSTWGPPGADGVPTVRELNTKSAYVSNAMRAAVSVHTLRRVCKAWMRAAGRLVTTLHAQSHYNNRPIAIATAFPNAMLLHIKAEMNRKGRRTQLETVVRELMARANRHLVVHDHRDAIGELEPIDIAGAYLTADPFFVREQRFHHIGSHWPYTVVRNSFVSIGPLNDQSHIGPALAVNAPVCIAALTSEQFGRGFRAPQLVLGDMIGRFDWLRSALHELFDPMRWIDKQLPHVHVPFTLSSRHAQLIELLAKLVPAERCHVQHRVGAISWWT